MFAGVCNKITASWWTLLLARIFGEKIAAIDEWGGRRCIIIAYRWRGILYVTDIRHESRDTNR